MQNFQALGLSERSLDALKKKGFETPTSIQKLAIPLLLQSDVDVVAQAQTGTGKTAAFALPVIEKLLDAIEEGSLEKHQLGAIVLAPTRELVSQIAEEVNSLKGNSTLSVAAIYGGQSMGIQTRQLKKGVNLIIATPGRLIDHINRKNVSLAHIQYFILDEADEMLNMGFIDDISDIFERTPPQRRVLLFSATMPKEVKKLGEKYMGSYEHVKSQEKGKKGGNISQYYTETSFANKFEVLCRVLGESVDFYGIIFCRTRQDVNNLTSDLNKRGYRAEGLHGEISQPQREKVLNKLKEKYISIVVATDVAARGIDVDHLSHVINYGLPQTLETYTHRIGRTGRAGREGIAITLFTPGERRNWASIQRSVGNTIQEKSVPLVEEIISLQKEKCVHTILKQVEDVDLHEYNIWAQDLLNDIPPSKLVGALLKKAFGKILDKKAYKSLEKFQRNSKEQTEDRFYRKRRTRTSERRNQSNQDRNRRQKGRSKRR